MSTQPYGPFEPTLPERPDTLSEFVERRTSLQEQAEAIAEKLDEVDAYALDALRRYETEPIHDQFRNHGHDSRALAGLVPCGTKGIDWKVERVTSDGIVFTHDCQDHGYDLPDSETFTLPLGYIRDPAGWRADRQARIDAAATARAAQSEAAARAQYDRLHTRFGANA